MVFSWNDRDNSNPLEKGNITVAVIVAELMMRGYVVSRPEGEVSVMIL